MRIAAALLSLLFVQFQARAVNNKSLAHEITPLIDRMDPHDPAKLTMVLRLADTLFESAVEVDPNVKFDARGVAEMNRVQRKAISLYEYALSGLNGAVAKPALDKQYKIKYQMARLYVDLGQTSQAESLWKILAQQNLVKSVQREAALRIAEKDEISNKRADIESAGKYYALASANCDKPDLCSYIQYRQGWIEYRLGRNDEAVHFLLESVKTTDAASVDQILTDLNLFLAHSAFPATQSIDILNRLSAQFHRPSLIESLSMNYLSADQTENYDQTLHYLNKEDPHLEQLIAILDLAETKGNLVETQSTLQKLEQSLAQGTAFSSPAKKTESEKKLFRLIFQWDAQRKTRPEIYTDLVGRGAIVYTVIYPAGAEYEKVTDGWLAVQTDPLQKIKQVIQWRAQQNSLGQKPVVLHLDQILLALHQQAKLWNEVVMDTDRIQPLTKESAEKRKLTYQKARALYELKKVDLALPLFKALAVTTHGKPDSIAIFSQNLSLDILAQQNKYDEIQSQANSWIADPQLQHLGASDQALTKEMRDMKSVANRAAFTKAAANKDQASLKTFSEFCLSNQLLPQSCDNALGLASQLHEEKTTIAILRHQNKTADLINELEFAGYFAEAASEREKQIGKASPKTAELLKIALLYEVAGEMKERNRILNQLTKNLQTGSRPLPENEEKLVYLTLRDAGLITPGLLKISWSEPIKIQLANALEDSGQGTAETRKMLLADCHDTGLKWTALQLEQLQNLNRQQEKLSILGRRSQQNFELRVAGLRKLSDASQCFLKASRQVELRVKVIAAIAQGYGDFSSKISSVPLPEGLDPETLKEAKEKIAAMAQPFDELRTSWLAQAKQEVLQAPILERERLEQKYISTQARLEFTAETAASTSAKPALVFNWNPLLKELQNHPFESAPLSQLKSHFSEQGSERLSAYFEGRLKSQGVER